MLQIILLFSFFSIFLLCYSLLKYYYGKQNSITRLKKYISIEEIREEKRKAKSKEFKTGLNFISKGIGNARFLDGYKKKVQAKLTNAHILLKAEEYITICITLFCTASFITFILSKNLLFAIIAGIVGWIIPSIIVRAKIMKRLKQLNDQLNDAIVLISNSLKAGYSFFQAVDTVSKEMTGPIAEEFSVMLKEINLGLTTEKALENLAGRVKSDDLELVVTAVLIQRQVGGNLSEVLDSISSTIRGRIKIKGEVKTVTAQGRMSGLVISLLPPVLGGIIYLINPEHIGLLFKSNLGIAILVFSVFMELIGIYFINKIVKIEV